MYQEILLEASQHHFLGGIRADHIHRHDVLNSALAAQQGTSEPVAFV